VIILWSIKNEISLDTNKIIKEKIVNFIDKENISLDANDVT